MSYAPIALFVYKRLWHTQQTMISLQNNFLAKESHLYIFSDGAKEQDQLEVEALRAWLKEIRGFKKITIIERAKNWGLAASIIDGVTQLTAKYGKVIVVEDDLILSPYFLKYMNDGLNLYQDEEKVASIHGYNFPVESMPHTFFLRGADCWGWATWQRAWKFFEPDGKKLLAAIQQQKLSKLFNFNNTQDNVLMLKRQIAGKNNSWAIRWHASAFLRNMLTLYPGKSLVSNIGLDNSGEHCGKIEALKVTLNTEPMDIQPIVVDWNQEAFLQIVQYFKSVRPSLYQRVLRKLKMKMSALWN